MNSKNHSRTGVPSIKDFQVTPEMIEEYQKKIDAEKAKHTPTQKLSFKINQTRLTIAILLIGLMVSNLSGVIEKNFEQRKKEREQDNLPAEIEREENGEIKQDQTAEDLSSKVKKWWDELDLNIFSDTYEPENVLSDMDPKTKGYLIVL